jgi:hypothetical protein
VPGTRTLVSYAVPSQSARSEIHGLETDRLLLSAMHHYTPDALKQCIERELDVEVIHESHDANVCQLLAQRRA